MPQQEGIPYRLEVPVWYRGPARIAQHTGVTKFIVLEQRRATLHAVVGSAELLFDFERVASEESALQFVGKYGLLEMENRPFFPAAWVMPLDRFLWLAQTVRTCLLIHRWLTHAVAGDAEALAELRKLEGEMLGVTGRAGMGVVLEPNAKQLVQRLKVQARSSHKARVTDSELLALSAQALAFLMNIGLLGVEERVSAAIAWPEPGEAAEWPSDAFTMAIHPRGLLGTVFHHLALYVLNRRPLASCERCGSLYFQEDPRQRFCTVRCADRARRERWRESHAAKVTKARKGARKAVKK